MSTILGVITARGGSKGIPGKNIKELGGKPLIYYTIEAAKQSGVFDRVILSTDDESIAKVAKEYGCDVPFMRPQELAKDTTPHISVMKHAVETLRGKEGYEATYTAILQPTAPFRQVKHIKGAVDLLKSSDADSVMTVSEIPGHYNPHWAIKLDSKNLATLMLSGEPVQNRIPRRQELPKAYINNGALYIFKTDLLYKEKPTLYGDKVVGYMMDEKFSVNIDEPADWKVAEQRLKELQD